MACETTYVFLRFLRFFKIQKTWLFTFFEWLTTFSRTLLSSRITRYLFLFAYYWTEVQFCIAVRTLRRWSIASVNWIVSARLVQPPQCTCWRLPWKLSAPKGNERAPLSYHTIQYNANLYSAISRKRIEGAWRQCLDRLCGSVCRGKELRF